MHLGGNWTQGIGSDGSGQVRKIREPKSKSWETPSSKGAQEEEQLERRWKTKREGLGEFSSAPVVSPLMNSSCFHFLSIVNNAAVNVRVGFPGGTSGKEPTCQRRRHKRCGFDRWVGKIPWRRTWQPTLVFLSGESHGQRSLTGYSS